MKRDPVDVDLLLERLEIDWDSRGGLKFFLCPAHEEKTASCRIIDDESDRRHGQVRCYGCGFGGWPVRLVMEVLQCTELEAYDWLKDMTKPRPVPFGVVVDYQQTERKKRLQLPPGFVSKQLEAWSPKARNYAEVKRHLKDWQIIKWSIGYTPTVLHSEKNPCPGRIIIPAFDAKGRLANYTGRTYMDSRLRYKSAGLDEGADPAAVFGEQHWGKVKRVVIVTEGAFDALAVERAYPEIPLAALYGSQLHERHVQKLSQFDAVFMATDPDRAGNSVVAQLEQELARWVMIERVRIDPGFDCDSLEPLVLKDRLSEVFDKYNAAAPRWVVGNRPRKRLKIAKEN